jgi:hypothetical protein
MAEKQVQLQCGKCQKPFMTDIPHPILMNQEPVSIVCWMHEKPVECTNCEQKYQFIVKAVQNVSFVFVPIESITPPEERLIVVPDLETTKKLTH